MDAPQEPRWLDAEESQAWRALASTLVRLPAALDAQLRRDAGLSHFEYQVLALLSEAPGRTLRMSALATLAGSSLPRLSQVVSRLERDHRPFGHPDELPVSTPATGAEYREVRAEIRAPVLAPLARLAAVLQQRGHQVPSAHRRDLVAHLGHGLCGPPHLPCP